MATQKAKARHGNPVVPIYRKHVVGEVEVGAGDTPLEAAVLHTIAEFIEQTPAGVQHTDAFEFDAYGARVQVRLGDACISDEELMR